MGEGVDEVVFIKRKAAGSLPPEGRGKMTEASRQALAILRDPGQFQWYVIPLFVLVVYVYAVEVERRNWSLALAGLAFWGMDWFNEIWNGLVFHFSGRSACWTAPGKTAFLLLIGLNLEISLMFAILGIVLIKMLPVDRARRIWGLPNRWFFAGLNSILCVFIEILLNRAGALVWEYSWWNFPNVFLIVLLGYLPFMVVSFWVYDMEKLSRQIGVVATIFAVDLVGLAVFAGMLKWI